MPGAALDGTTLPTTNNNGSRTDPYGNPYTQYELDFMNQPLVPVKPGSPVPGHPGYYYGPNVTMAPQSVPASPSGQPVNTMSGTPSGSLSTGGGSSADDFYQQLIAQQEAEAAAREARIAEAMGVINNVFANRDQVYNQYADATYNLNKDRLDTLHSEEARNLKFALARAGNLGGSVDVDKNAQLGDRYNQGLLDARSFADNSAAAARAAEDQARYGLLGLASTGNVTGAQINSLASENLASANQALKAPPFAPDLSNAFNGISNTIGQALLRIGAANTAYPGGTDQYNSYLSPNSGKPYYGTVTG